MQRHERKSISIDLMLQKTRHTHTHTHKHAEPEQLRANERLKANDLSWDVVTVRNGARQRYK